MRKSTKFSPELRERAIRLVGEQRAEHESQWAAIVSIAGKMRRHPFDEYNYYLKELDTMKVLMLVVLVSLGLAGCFSPQSRKAEMQRIGEACMSSNAEMADVIPCLNKHGVELGEPLHGEYSSVTCGPYWGWPFLASCGGLRVKAVSDRVASWEPWAYLDGP